MAESDTCRGSGGDDIAGLQRDDARKIRDQIRNAEDQVPCVGVLENLAIDRHFDFEGMRIGDFIASHHPRTHGAERIKRLAHQPLGCRKLIIASAHVVDNRIAENVILPLLGGDVASALSDDKGELSFVVRLFGPWEDDIIAGPDDGGGELVEDRGNLSESPPVRWRGRGNSGPRRSASGALGWAPSA